VLRGNQTFDAGVVANLGAGESITLANINVRFTSADTYILQFQADNANQIAESNEFDNNATLNVTVTNVSSPRSP
jgi:subtilase family serine protease